MGALPSRRVQNRRIPGLELSAAADRNHGRIPERENAGFRTEGLELIRCGKSGRGVDR
jgi:hypothetical protein